VRDDQLVLPGDGRQPVAGHPDVLALVVYRHWLPAAQQGVSAQGHYDSHDIPHMPASYPIAARFGRG
jgi:hypothetical protein